MSVDLHSARTVDSEQRPQQRYPRALFSVPVTLRHLEVGGIRASGGITLDISEGGLGAIVRGGLRAGELVEIDVSIAGCALTAVAIVRYTTDARCGFEFVGLTPEERQQIANATGHA
jgi:PilZ domain-containing protein